MAKRLKKKVKVKTKSSRKKTTKAKKDSGLNYKLRKDLTSNERIYSFVELARPMEWSKSLLNMWIGVMMAFYVFSFQIDFNLFIMGFISVALLWSGLYALNDYTDWKIDFRHKVKKVRPIPSGRIAPKEALLFSVVAVVLSFVFALVIGIFLLSITLLIMLLNQLLYTVKPFHFKTRKYLDFISGSMVNPIFRYFSGMVLFVPGIVLFTNSTPILPLLFVIGIQFGGYSLYRLFSKKQDVALKMKSSVALLSEKKVKAFAYSAMVIAILAYIAMLLNGLTLKQLWLGYLPVQFFIAILLPLLFAPMLKDAVLKPTTASMKKSYRVTYAMTLTFIAANIVIFVIWP